MREVTIIKAGGANFASIEYAMERIGVKVFYAQTAKDIQNSERLLLPGVGSMQNVEGRLDGIKSVIKNLTQPVLGICLGMQMLFENSAEAPETQTLGIIKGNVVGFGDDVISPHTGWNKILHCNGVGSFSSIPEGYAYFTHSFYVPVESWTASYCNYGHYKVSAIVEQKNFFGFQFHPEKSGKYGEELLNTFFNIK